jgi:calcineurin-like phosphoesterase family protein
MPAIWLVSDTHFGHEKCCTVFKRPDGSPLRPFASAEEMDEEMVRRWNERVRPSDKVYHLGDVVINRKSLTILERLNGKKRLIRGNHDIFPIEDYQKYFDEIYGVRVLDDIILSHIPLHPASITFRFGTNVHGHLHANDLEDPRYLNVCVEHTDFAPISLEEVHTRIQAKRDRFPDFEYPAARQPEAA